MFSFLLSQMKQKDWGKESRREKKRPYFFHLNSGRFLYLGGRRKKMTVPNPMKLEDTTILLKMVGRTVVMLLSSTIKECFGKLLLHNASEKGALLPTGLQNFLKYLLFESKFWQGSKALIFQNLMGIYPEIHKNIISIHGKIFVCFLFLQKYAICLILLKFLFEYFKG